MIYTRVQLQFAKETGLRVDDGQLDKAIARIAEDNKISLAQMRATLEKDGVNFAKFREEIRDEIVMSRLREREVDNKITIADSEVDNLLNALQLQDGKTEEFDLSHILIRVPEQVSPEQLRERRARAEQALGADQRRHRFQAGRGQLFRGARCGAGRRHGLARTHPAADDLRGRR